MAAREARTVDWVFARSIPEPNTGCWLWLGAVDRKGYGKTTDASGRHAVASRVALAAVNGPIPPGHYVCHRCDQPSCCNPAHLFLGTHKENMADMRRKGRSCTPKRRGETHGSSVLSANQVAAIRRRHAAGEDKRHLAAEFGVTQPNIHQIVTRKTWRHV